MLCCLQDGKFEAEVKLILGLGSLQLGEVKNMLLWLQVGCAHQFINNFFVACMNMTVDCKHGENLESGMLANVLPSSIVLLDW